MKILKNKRVAVAISYPDLPAGYDDESSPFYVPEPLRPHYPATADLMPLDGWYAKVVETVGQRVKEEMWNARDQADANRRSLGFGQSGEPLTRKPEEIASERDTRVQAILDTQYGHYLALEQHAARLKVAEFDWQIATRALEAEEARIAAETCPVCQECEPIKRGHVQARPLVAGAEYYLGDPVTRAEVPQINSCAACATIAQAEYLEHLASQPGPDFQHPTLRDAVRATIGLARRTAQR